MRTAEHNANIGASLKARGAGASPSKVCPRCQIEFPRESFGVRKGGYTKTYCPPCERAKGRARSRRMWHSTPVEVRRAANRKTSLKRYYGMTVEQYDELLSAQDGVCAICGGEQTHGRTFLDVDHDHATGAIRGLLCSHCNRAIGFLLDDPVRMRAAAAYLEGVR